MESEQQSFEITQQKDFFQKRNLDLNVPNNQRRSLQIDEMNINPLLFSMYSQEEPSQTIANVTFDMRQMKHTYKDNTGDIFTYEADWIVKLNFLNSVSVSLESPKRAIYGENQSFIFYINQKQITVPVNAINLDKQLQIGDYLVSYQENYYNQLPLEQNDLTQTNAALSTDTYFSKLKGVFMPYIPYFSNCRQFGSMGFFYQITENHENCNLVSPQNVKVIDPFVFGDKPYSDECENVGFDCVLDEYTFFPFTQDLWYRQQKEQALFSMKASPYQFNSEEANSDEIPIDDLVEIQIDSEVPENKLPKKISLQINYYQINSLEKQIINGQINFESFVTPTDDQANGKEPFNYDLLVSFHSMTQSELTIAFALDIRVYLIMYFIIGFFSLMSICIFTGYHIILRRSKSKFQTKIIECIQTIYPSAIYGTFLTLIPLGIILILNLAIMGGRFWDYQFNIYGCDPKTDSCQLTIFDNYKDDEISFSDDEMDNLRNGRYGLSIIIIGLYIMYACSDLLISQNKTKEEYKLEQYASDGNSWFKRFWEKSYFMLFYFFMIIIMEIIIQWSISTNFGENVWYYLCTLKILGMLSEILGSKFFSKKILSAPIAYGLDCTLDVATLGANDFIDFLLSFFIEQGIQMIERTYINVIMKEVEDFIDVAQESWEARQKEEQQDTLLNLSLIQQDDGEQTLNNSSVYFSDNFEESFESLFQNQGSDIEKNQKRKKHQLKMQSDIHRQTKTSKEELNSSFDESDENDINESYFKNLLDSKLQGQQLNRKNQSQILAKEKINDQANKKQNLQSQKNHEIDTDSDEVIDRYADFVNGMIGPLVLPIITSQCWIFYEQNQIANAYNIERESYIYYFLFTVIILPFRLAIDIVYYHLWVGYHDMDFLDYAKKSKKRFLFRKQAWKANEPNIESKSEGEESGEQMQIKEQSKKENRKIDEELVDLDRWCFSSQFYFVHSLFLIGMMNCVFGIYNITSAQHNLFKDQMTFPIIFLWIILCYFVHKICIVGGKFFGIWKVKQNVETNIEEKQNVESSQGDLEQNIKQQNKKEKVKIIQKEKEQMKVQNYINLKKSQFENPNFRKNFIQSNKYWLRRNISKVLNKETKQKYRDLILEQMENINLKLKKRSDFKHYLLMKKMKRIKQNLFMAENKEALLNNSKNSNIQNQSDQEFDDYMYNLEQDYYLEDQQRQNLFSLEAQMKPNRPSDIPNSTKILIKYWLYRSRNYSKACALVGGIFDKKIKQYCQFCGNNWGLTCQPEQNVEDLFLQYIRKMNFKNVTTDKQKDGWQDYFQEQCLFRTECFDCNQLAADNFQKICKENKIKAHINYKASCYLNCNKNMSQQFLLELQQDENSQNLFGSTVEDRGDYTPIDEEEEQKNQQQLVKAKQLDIKQYQIQPKQFQDQRQNKMLGLRRMNQITPASTQRDSLQDLSFLVSNKSTSRQPFISQQTNEFTNTQIPISEINLDKSQTKFQKYQKNFVESTLKQNYLQSEKLISDIQLNSFAENQTLFNDEDNIKLSNRSYNVYSSINKFDDCESKLDTSRGQLQKMQDFQVRDTVSLSRLLVSQNTYDVQTDEAYAQPNKQIQIQKSQNQNFEDFKNEKTLLDNNKFNQKYSTNQNLTLQIKLSKFVRLWKQLAQDRLKNKN